METVGELRKVSLLALERVFGRTQSEFLYEASHGYDRSPVQPKGPPKSVSVEDSFRQCCDEGDLLMRMHHLAADLVERMARDYAAYKRHPTTLRLAVRNKSNPKASRFKRESRQGAMPAGAFQNDSEAAAKALVVACFSLFRKIVPANTPFHVVVLNLAITNFQSVASQASAITAFLTTGPSATDTAVTGSSSGSSKRGDGVSRGSGGQRRSGGSAESSQSSRLGNRETTVFKGQIRTVDYTLPTLADTVSGSSRKNPHRSGTTHTATTSRSTSSTPATPATGPPAKNSQASTGHPRTNRGMSDLTQSDRTQRRQDHGTAGGTLIESATVTLSCGDQHPATPSNTSTNDRSTASNNYNSNNATSRSGSTGGGYSRGSGGGGGPSTRGPSTRGPSGRSRGKREAAEDEEVPGDIDPDVYKALPKDIRRELLVEWKFKQLGGGGGGGSGKGGGSATTSSSQAPRRSSSSSSKPAKRAGDIRGFFSQG